MRDMKNWSVRIIRTTVEFVDLDIGAASEIMAIDVAERQARSKGGLKWEEVTVAISNEGARIMP